jgi:hypothetical protein
MSEIFPKNMTVKQAVLSTLAYFHLFGVPLTRSEISEHLFWAEPDEKHISSYLRESPLITERNGYYGLSTDAAFQSEFTQKIQRSRTLWKKVRRFQWIFSICPFVKLVCVCNSLPIYATTEDSDIDLFVVTQKNRLFLARLCLILLTSVMGVRRHGDKVRARFCLSFFISEERMDFSSLTLKPYDIYLAYWIKTLEPIAGDFGEYEKFLSINTPWLSEYFKTIQAHRRYFRKRSPLQEKIKAKLEGLLDKDEWEEKWKQNQLRRAKDKFYSLKNRSGTVISETMLKFHDEDRREDIRKEWISALQAF